MPDRDDPTAQDLHAIRPGWDVGPAPPTPTKPEPAAPPADRQEGGPFDVGAQIDGPDDPLLRGADPTEPEQGERCPTCGSDDPAKCHRDHAFKHDAGGPPHRWSDEECCRDNFHYAEVPEPTDDREREFPEFRLWRCPECGASGVYPVADEPLPGGPALCAHPTANYETWPICRKCNRDTHTLYAGGVCPDCFFEPAPSNSPSTETWTITYDDERRKLVTDKPFPVTGPVEVVPASLLDSTRKELEEARANERHDLRRILEAADEAWGFGPEDRMRTVIHALLATLPTTGGRSLLERAEKAEVSLAESEARLREAERELDEARELHRRSFASYRDAEDRAETAETRAEALESRLREAREALERIEEGCGTWFDGPVERVPQIIARHARAAISQIDAALSDK